MKTRQAVKLTAKVMMITSDENTLLYEARYLLEFHYANMIRERLRTLWLTEIAS